MGNQESFEMIVTMLLRVLQGINESDEFFDLIASMAKKQYNALLDVGFTEEQAVQIIAGLAARGGK